MEDNRMAGGRHHGCPLRYPGSRFSSARAYFDSLRTENLPMNLLQAQRDYFGAHTYHTQW